MLGIMHSYSLRRYTVVNAEEYSACSIKYEGIRKWKA